MERETVKIFSHRLKMARIFKGITQEEMAKDLGVSKGAVGHWEIANRAPGIEMLVKISKYLDLSVEYLLGQSDMKNKSVIADYIIDSLIEANLMSSEEIDIDTIGKFLDYMKAMKQINEKYPNKK